MTHVADLHTVLAALAEPVRLEMTRRLFVTGEAVGCAALYDTVTKATASHHFKILREAGIVERHALGQGAAYTLRFEEVEAAYPGLLAAVLNAAPTR
ncbi:ArsR/SmtB family transcription factor [Gordonia humi]|uniref:DNA-binding transcriptional ArsR family regulator n=1 Tax=Gordonia humi TaxID=686429 RepID=A0A840EWJ3_9ACTN|nr:helix-turn-helix transcriptional regulator [Gordonia humi]MBB4134674.1 DNA-binding transcriptional ArsR family regulator [Gordonia humi]